MTPLDIEILLHYHCCASEFERLDAPACRETIENFLKDGILRSRSPEENEDIRYRRAYATTPRGDALVAALCDVPYPVQQWIQPSRRCPSKGQCSSASCLDHNSCDRI